MGETAQARTIPVGVAKPCPWCGEQPITPYDPDLDIPTVGCECPVGPWIAGEDIDDAIRYWNDRRLEDK